MRPALVLFVALLSACAPSDPPEAAPRPAATTTAPDPNSLPALFDEDIEGSDLREIGPRQDFGAYTGQAVTFRSGDVTVSGVLSVPKGEGPFPAVTLNHGYIPHQIYANGQGMPRERDYLARAGFVVLHVDYRGHAQSDAVPEVEHELRLGYVRDAIAAVKALKERSDVDADRVAMAGRSMGGGVTFGALVAEPDLVDAAVVWASVSTRFVDNFRRWVESERPDRARAFVERWGTIEEKPAFWRGLSPRYYLDRVNAAVMMHHGTEDEQCPYPWAQQTDAALRRGGADVTFHTYVGEHHTFSRDWELSMRRTVEFLRERA